MASWKDLRRFCEADDREVRDTDHYCYRKREDDRKHIRTKVSKGSGQIQGSLWKEVLKKQLLVDQEYFNRKVEANGFRLFY